jgi:hypothetical protein
LLDFDVEFVHNLQEQFLGTGEEAKVVERAAAAQMRARDEHVEASGFEDFGGGNGGRGLEVVVESVGPEKNLVERAGRPLDSRRDAGATIELRSA